MELFLIIGIVAAFFFGYSQGGKEGEEKALSLQKQKVHAGMAPHSPFHNTYGMPGFYLADTSPAFSGIPLTCISSADFLEIIAKNKAPSDASHEEIEKVKEQLVDSYSLATGMDPETLKALKLLFTPK